MAPDGSSHIPQWSFADRIRKVRRDAGLTQDEMADRLGVKPVTLSAWESGRTRPQDIVELAGQVEREFRVPAAWVLGVLTSPPTATSEMAAVPPRRGLPPVPPPRAYGRRWSDHMTFQAAVL